MANDLPCLRLHFWDRHDITADTYGKIEFRAHPLEDLGRAPGYPAQRLGCAVPRKEGGYWVYGWSCWGKEHKFKPENPLEVIRSWTTDGISFHDAQTVYSEKSQRWLGFVNIVPREADGVLFMFAWARGKPGHAVHVYSSADGEKWERLASPAYTDHDACCFVWHNPSKQFVNFQTTYQNLGKRYPDNIGGRRRVLSLRTSTDGVNWKPNLNVGWDGPYRAAKDLIVPDEQDPKELEFYRVCAFPLHGRLVGLLCKYAPSPQIANTRKGTKHGPGLGVEWFFCRDGFRLERPSRDVDATGKVGFCPLQGPIRTGGMLRFYEGYKGNSMAGIREDRIFHAFCRANGEFSSALFTAPNGDLLLNVSANEYDSYVMVELHDKAGKVIRGFEKQHCGHMGVDDTGLRLRWQEKSPASLAGKVVRMRFYLRNARIYGVRGTVGERP